MDRSAEMLLILGGRRSGSVAGNWQTGMMMLIATWNMELAGQPYGLPPGGRGCRVPVHIADVDRV